MRSWHQGDGPGRTCLCVEAQHPTDSCPSFNQFRPSTVGSHCVPWRSETSDGAKLVICTVFPRECLFMAVGVRGWVPVQEFHSEEEEQNGMVWTNSPDELTYSSPKRHRGVIWSWVLDDKVPSPWRVAWRQGTRFWNHNQVVLPGQWVPQVSWQEKLRESLGGSYLCLFLMKFSLLSSPLCPLPSFLS